MRALFLEPFDGGSHHRFLRDLTTGLRDSHGVDCTVLTMPGRHWKWRMRGAVPWLAQEHDAALRDSYDLLFASSYLALAELIGLYPGLGRIPRVLYFHENQLAYPVREELAGVERDTHFGFTQMVSALAATRCVFNSEYNRQTFCTAGTELLGRMPDARLRTWREQIEDNSEVLGVPMHLPVVASFDDTPANQRQDGPTLLWNHRWEHDKNPAEFFEALTRLADAGVAFRLIVCGEQFEQVPDPIQLGHQALADRIDHFGFVADRAAYEDLLQRSQIVVSTAVHEFFGLSILEATWCGARPLVPDRLVYRELLPEEFRYRDLEVALRGLCHGWKHEGLRLRADRRELVAPHRADVVVPQYYALFERLLGSS
ncbi:MAG: DUF3524 domain-containing protein [Planctomycetota bacterium]|nr:DUF3524 domain-containing protein [Planctomycetota bacterium]